MQSGLERMAIRGYEAGLSLDLIAEGVRKTAGTGAVKAKNLTNRIIYEYLKRKKHSV